MRRVMLVLVVVVLLVGVVGAATFHLGEMVVGDFVAGGSTEAVFSFDYVDDGDGLMNSSLVLRVNMSSLENEENCPLPDCSVWDGDFSMLGVIRQYTYFWPFEQERIIPLSCVDDDFVNFSIVNRGLLYSQENFGNGTFYCYNKNNYLNTLELDKRDEVTLKISSHQALYPGNYSVSVELMEMEPDVAPPVMDLILDGYIFGENDTIPIRLDVSDMYNIYSVEYEIMNPSLSDFYSSGWIEVLFNESSGWYEDDFNMTENGLNKSGEYEIKARTCDVLGNCGDL